MAGRSELSHVRWMEEIWELARYPGTSIGQNIAMYTGNAVAVVDALYASDGHRENMLKQSYGQLGVGCILDQDGRMWWTHNFGG